MSAWLITGSAGIGRCADGSATVQGPGWRQAEYRGEMLTSATWGKGAFSLKTFRANRKSSCLSAMI